MSQQIRVEHYSTRQTEYNWYVFLDGKRIGQMHYLDGIGGEIGEHTDTDLFDIASDLCEQDLRKRSSTMRAKLDNALNDNQIAAKTSISEAIEEGCSMYSLRVQEIIEIIKERVVDYKDHAADQDSLDDAVVHLNRAIDSIDKADESQ